MATVYWPGRMLKIDHFKLHLCYYFQGQGTANALKPQIGSNNFKNASLATSRYEEFKRLLQLFIFNDVDPAMSELASKVHIYRHPYFMYFMESL